jgi:hypothetical protein
MNFKVDHFQKNLPNLLTKLRKINFEVKRTSENSKSVIPQFIWNKICMKITYTVPSCRRGVRREWRALAIVGKAATPTPPDLPFTARLQVMNLDSYGWFTISNPEMLGLIVKRECHV